ncbi:MAG: anion transporter [Deltaproteobacteria bacterium]|nr:anion transporter [Deltaproteobacteria bacterium]
MNRATIAVVGATSMVLAGSLTLEQAYAAIDADTLVLLFGMMVLNANLRIAGFFEAVATGAVGVGRSPLRLLALTVAASGLLSAILLNDTVALGMTPLVLEVVHATGLPAAPFLIAVATAANVGSTATIIGNPQNMLVGMASGIPFGRFFYYLGPVAVLGCVIVWAVIALVYRRALHFRPLAWSHRARVEVNESLLRKSLIATAVLAAALLCGMPTALAALTAASLLLVTRRHDPERVFAEIDWSLLVFFAGLFVVTAGIDDGLRETGVFEELRHYAESGVAGLAVLTVGLSNVVSNVPAVLLLRGPVEGLDDCDRGFLTLAMASTLAGNLTLLGSVANLIVAEVARRRGQVLSFREYLKAGVPITLATLALGVAWIDWMLG